MTNKTKIKVSVVIPVYNTVEYLEDSVNCVLCQTLSELEIIIINDGSTDNSYQLIQELAASDGRIKVHNQKNRGLSETRNLGIRIAQGEYIYFMDSDDLIDKHTFSECYEKCTQNNLDFLFFDAEVFGLESNSLTLNYRRGHLIPEGIYTGKEMLQGLFKVNGFRSSACLVFTRTSYLKKINLHFYPGILHEDELFTLLLFIQADRISFINKPYFKRRIRSNSIMGVPFSKRNLEGYFTVFSELHKFSFQSKEKLSKILIKKRLTNIIESLFYNFRSMQPHERYSLLFHCLLHYPGSVRLRSAVLLVFPWVSKLKHVKAND